MSPRVSALLFVRRGMAPSSNRENREGARAMRPLALAIHLLAASGALVSAGWSADAQAQAPSSSATAAIRRYDIASGPLSEVLTRFSGDTGVYVVGASAEAMGKTSPGVRGSYAAAAALQALLVGTGLQAVLQSDGSYSLRPAPAVAGEGRPSAESGPLPVVTVTARVETDAEAARRLNPPTTVGSKAPLAQREIAQTVHVVTQDQIVAQNLTTVADVVDRSPGVTVIRGLPTPYLGSQAYARGWQITNYNVDGIPTTIDLMPQQNSAMYDRVEILHGASGLYSGLGGAGGTINVVHKQPASAYAFNSSASVGTRDTYLGQLDVTGPLNAAGTLRGRGVIAWQRLGDDNGSFDKGSSLFGILEADIAPQTVAQLGASYGADSGRPDGGFPNYPDGRLLNPSRSASTFAAPWWRYTNDAATVFGNIGHRLDSGWALKLAGTYAQTKTLNHNAWAAGTVNPATGTFPAWTAYSPYSRHEQAYDAYADGPLTLFQREHRLTIGANYHKSHLRTDLNEPWDLPTTSFDTAATLPGSNWESTGGGVYRDLNNARTENYGIYANARIRLADPLTLIVGGRLGWYRSSSSDEYNNNGDFSSLSSQYSYSRKVTPFAGLVYDIDARYSAYLSYSTVFTPRDSRDKAGHVMKPLEGSQFELGIKGTHLDGKLTTSAAVFRGTQRNRIVPDPSDRNFFIPAGSARVQGVEAQASGQPLPNLTVSGGYAYLSTKIFDTNATGSNFNQYTPKHMFKLWANYALPGDMGQWSVGGGLAVVSSSGFQTWHQGGHATADASIGYQVDRHVQLSLTVKNLFDRYYYDYVGSGYNHLGPGRSAMLTVRGAY